MSSPLPSSHSRARVFVGELPHAKHSGLSNESSENFVFKMLKVLQKAKTSTWQRRCGHDKEWPCVLKACYESSAMVSNPYSSPAG